MSSKPSLRPAGQPLEAHSVPVARAQGRQQASWLPLTVVVTTQFLVSFNLSALAICARGIGESFDTPPASFISTAIVAHSSLVAGLILLGAKLGQSFGSRGVFRTMVALFGVAMILVVISPNPAVMIVAESIAGAAAAALIPTLFVLIGASYAGRERARALGWLAASQAIASVAALLIAGALGTWLGWRSAFALLALVAGWLFVLSYRLRPVERKPGASLDVVGLVLAALAIGMVMTGVNSLPTWGWWSATAAAPFALLGLSPAPLAIVGGLALSRTFFAWERRRYAARKATLISPVVISTPQERCAVISLFIIVALGASVRYLIPLYVEVIQGTDSLTAASAVLPYSLAVFVAALVVVSAQERLAPRTIARGAFVLVTAGLASLALAIRNDWGDAAVVGGLVMLGLAEGMLLTLLLNVLVSTSSVEQAEEVGSLRSTTSSLAAALGTALSTAILIGVLGASVSRDLASNPSAWEAVTTQLDLTNVRFVSNDRLVAFLDDAAFDAEQIEAALQLNTNARLAALRTSLAVLAVLALFGIFPAGKLPRYGAGEAPAR
ncbi:MAG TPA: MFS transporter [Gammaproteobacteria bacterium]